MTIKKIGHCCLLIKTNGLTVLTDPGSFTSAQDALTGIDLVLITHEHGDHCHLESVKAILKNNPAAQVITNAGVGKLLTETGLTYTALDGLAEMEVNGLKIKAIDGRHEEIYEEVGQVQNTGYLIDGRLFCPGDSFHNPQLPIEILALPVAGPWCRIGDAIRYALAIKPKIAFPIHDEMLQPDKIGANHFIPSKILPANNIEFVVMKNGEEKEF